MFLGGSRFQAPERRFQRFGMPLVVKVGADRVGEIAGHAAARVLDDRRGGGIGRQQGQQDAAGLPPADGVSGIAEVRLESREVATEDQVGEKEI